MGAYSKDLRLKVLAATDRGTPRREVVETFGTSLATLKRWLMKRAHGEDLSPRFSTGRRRPILSTVEERRALWAQLEGSDEATLEQHCELWEERREFLRRVVGISVSESTVSRCSDAWDGAEKKIARIATMVLATSRLSGLTRKKEGFVPFQRSVGRFGGRRGATGRSRA